MRFYRNYILPTFAISLIILSSQPTLADDKANFSKLVQDSSEQALVLSAAKQSRILLENPCPTATLTIENRFALYDPLQFDSSGKIISGAWKESVSENGCGQNRQLNVVIFVNATTHELQAKPIFPGTTRADPVLQKDGLLYAMIAASLPDDKDCKDMYVMDTEFLQIVGNQVEGTKSPPWDELWTLSVCGKKAQVKMHFIPDKTGTTIHTNPQETKFLPSDASTQP
jgi:hypothetical protein